MCGVFGDPASATDTLAIFRYFKKHNPNITLGMNTNGSIQNTKWWNELASIFTNELDYVVFSIDGLEDTNHIYRRNVNWHKVMNNMTTFINEGGKAHWDMLIFDHNKHQVDEAKQLAKTLGVSWFRSKVSKRFVTNPIKGLNPPKEFKLPNKNNINSIQCIALKDKSVYVSASGEILPCCWFGTLAFNRDGYATKLLNSKNWEMLEESWNKTPHFLCKETCGVNNDSKTIFELQWNDNIELETL
jgi:MoaA/NifB/PqqE/SkfB family radical SAM enzyme